MLKNPHSWVRTRGRVLARGAADCGRRARPLWNRRNRGAFKSLTVRDLISRTTTTGCRRCAPPPLGIGEGPGCGSRPSVRPRMSTLVTVISLISYVTRLGKILRRPLVGSIKLDQGGLNDRLRRKRASGVGVWAEALFGRSPRGFHHRRPARSTNLGCDGIVLMLSLWPHAKSTECGCLA